MCALTEAEGDGHFLFADGLVEEAYVSVHLREKRANKYHVRSRRVNGLGEAEKKESVDLLNHRPLARDRLSLESHARPPPSTSLDAVGAREWCLVLDLDARRQDGRERDGVMEKRKAEADTHQSELLWIREMAWNPQRYRWPA